MSNELKVYAGLYDEVAGNLSKAGKNFEYKKSTFLSDVKGHPQEIDVSRYLHLSNPEFVEAIYVAALKRLPDDRTRDFWAGKYHLPAPQFQKEVLMCIAGSSVVAINQIRLENNPYFVQRRGLKYKTLGLLYGFTDKSYLREFGKKLPAPVQKIIRQLFL